MDAHTPVHATKCDRLIFECLQAYFEVRTAHTHTRAMPPVHVREIPGLWDPYGTRAVNLLVHLIFPVNWQVGFCTLLTTLNH